MGVLQGGTRKGSLCRPISEWTPNDKKATPPIDINRADPNTGEARLKRIDIQGKSPQGRWGLGGRKTGMGTNDRGFFGGVSDYFGNLFTDPKRMALVRMGLGLMNPDNRYSRVGNLEVNNPWGAFPKAVDQALNTYATHPEFKRATELMKIDAWNRGGRGQGEFQRLLNRKNQLMLTNPNSPEIKAIDARLEYLVAIREPNDVRSFKFMQGLTPAERREWYLNKRASRPMDRGSQDVLDPTDPTQIIASFDKTLPPQDRPATRFEQEKQKQLGAYDAELVKTRPKVKLALRQAVRKAGQMEDWIDKAYELAGGYFAGGFTGAIAGAMPWPTDRSRLEDYLLTIKANLGFDKLQEMRDSSPTGGALGQVSEMENKLLQAVNGAINPKNPQVLRENLEIIRDLYPVVLEERMRLYEETYGESFDPRVKQRRATDPKGGGSSLAEKKARLEELKRKQGGR